MTKELRPWKYMKDNPIWDILIHKGYTVARLKDCVDGETVVFFRNKEDILRGVVETPNFDSGYQGRIIAGVPYNDNIIVLKEPQA